MSTKNVRVSVGGVPVTGFLTTPEPADDVSPDRLAATLEKYVETLLLIGLGNIRYPRTPVNEAHAAVVLLTLGHAMEECAEHAAKVEDVERRAYNVLERYVGKKVPYDRPWVQVERDIGAALRAEVPELVVERISFNEAASVPKTSPHGTAVPPKTSPAPTAPPVGPARCYACGMSGQDLRLSNGGQRVCGRCWGLAVWSGL